MKPKRDPTEGVSGQRSFRTAEDGPIVVLHMNPLCPPSGSRARTSGIETAVPALHGYPQERMKVTTVIAVRAEYG